VAENNDQSRRKIDWRVEGESVLWCKKNRSGNLITGAIRNSVLAGARLANLGAEKFAVALETYLSAPEKVSHSRDRFLRVAGAGTDGEDQIAK
jgi:hypothetical protein